MCLGVRLHTVRERVEDGGGGWEDERMMVMDLHLGHGLEVVKGYHKKEISRKVRTKPKEEKSVFSWDDFSFW